MANQKVRIKLKAYEHEVIDQSAARIVEAANAAAAKRGLAADMKLSDAVLPADGGLVLRRGSIEVNCTLDKLLEMSHSSLDAEVASVLFN